MVRNKPMLHTIAEAKRLGLLVTRTAEGKHNKVYVQRPGDTREYLVVVSRSASDRRSEQNQQKDLERIAKGMI